MIDLQARNSANASWQHPGGAANAGWSDTLTIDLPGQTGSAAVWLFSVAVNGQLASRGDGGAGIVYAGPVALMVGGQAVQGWTLDSASGHDWLVASAVPEPAAWMLLLPGLALLLRRRTARPG